MDSIADRVDLVKRACEATVEITRQIGAELAAAQGEVAASAQALDELRADLRVMGVANQSVDDERKRERRRRVEMEELVGRYTQAINRMRLVFGPGFGPGETAAFERLTQPQRRALDTLLKLPLPELSVSTGYPTSCYVPTGEAQSTVPALPQGPT